MSEVTGRRGSPSKLAWLVVLAACDSRPSQQPPPATTTPKSDASVDEGPGEVFEVMAPTNIRGDGWLAVGGGYVYWIEEVPGTTTKRVVKRKRAADLTMTPETVTEPMFVQAIAADAERLYVAVDRVFARSHTYGTITNIAGGEYTSLTVGMTTILGCGTNRTIVIPKTTIIALEGDTHVAEISPYRCNVAVDDDRYVVLSPPPKQAGKQPLTLYTPSHDPRVVFDTPFIDDVAMTADALYFTRSVEPFSPNPLYRMGTIALGEPMLIGDPEARYNEFIVRDGIFYGSKLRARGIWTFVKFPLEAPGAVVELFTYSSYLNTAHTLIADEAYIYYLTDGQIRRVPL